MHQRSAQPVAAAPAIMALLTGASLPHLGVSAFFQLGSCDWQNSQCVSFL